MINIDTAYQKVLTLANKEQRGYITPQEFNLLANKAQMDVYDNLFHNLKMAKHKQFGNEEPGYDEVSMLEEKLHPFRVEISSINAGGTAQGALIDTTDFDPEMYRLDSLLYFGVGGALQFDPVLITEVTQSEFRKMIKNPLTSPRDDRPVFYRTDGGFGDVMLKPVGSGYLNGTDWIWGFIAGSTFAADYWRVPENPTWGYVMVNDKPLYNPNTSTHFTLHRSDEEALVTRILELSGITLGKQELQQSIMVDKKNTKQEQNT